MDRKSKNQKYFTTEEKEDNEISIGLCDCVEEMKLAHFTEARNVVNSTFLID